MDVTASGITSGHSVARAQPDGGVVEATRIGTRRVPPADPTVQRGAGVRSAGKSPDYAATRRLVATATSTVRLWLCRRTFALVQGNSAQEL